ncbi:unnamed protein product [Candidula unifasciata]|uniref:Ribosomal RNA-processing protein 8 n=1 Tax=Candidula unifasciata TaxID=100452 RepID=A0A8S4A1B1_9EUPU|nr:unnamed protein product [Candidula unifasciata]
MFQFDTKWDVDITAESLNTSLFGKPKKYKLKKTTPAASINTSYVSAVLDSDDEQYTKKDKKKLKKRRKKNKDHDKTVEISSADLSQGFDVDSKIADKKKNVKISDKVTKNSQQKKKINVSPEIKLKSNVANAKPKKVKKDSKRQEPKLNTPSEERLLEKKNKKRKRSLSQSTDDLVGNKNKKAKVLEHEKSTVATGDVAESEEGKKKRKRNRKKKNNSKKNKYKHLALNSKSKAQNSDISQGSELSSQNLKSTVEKPSVHSSKLSERSQTLDSTQSYDHIQKNTDSSIDTILPDSEVLVQKQKKNIDNHTGSSTMDSQIKSKSKKRKSVPDDQTGSSTMDSQIKSKSKKRKSVQDNHMPSTKKLEQGNNNSNDETTVTSSDVQPATRTTKSDEQNSVKPGISLKNKKKQQMLLKLLTGTPIKKGSSDVSNKKDSIPDKKNRKIPLENGSADNNKNSIKQGKKLESISEDALKKPTLDSARFRYINEQLYSCTGGDAMKLFKEDRAAFAVYHEGFQNQVHKWPVNPLDIFIKQIKDKPKNLVIADFGCGDAKLAENIPQKVHSFDLVALNNRITVCDMSKTPLPGEQVDIAIFCLSLMGTNITDYILEANRVLKTGGLLKIAEVVSRFSGLSRFIEGVCHCGFQLLNKRDTNQMFYLLDFKKIKPVKKSASIGQIKLKPCIYKRR